jgi:hypothetical protein
LLTSRCRVSGGPRSSAMLGMCEGQVTDSTLRKMSNEDLAWPSYPAGKACFRRSDAAYITQFLCARSACSLPSLLLLSLVGGVWAPTPDVGVSWPGTLPPVPARRSRESEPLSMSSRASVSYANDCVMDHARPRKETRRPHRMSRGGCGRRGRTGPGSGTCPSSMRSSWREWLRLSITEHEL